MNLDRCTSGQRVIVETLDVPLMVSAGAGSGKTFTLTQRIVNALRPADGSAPALRSVDEVLAITFTRKAAAELRGRIKALLVAEGMRDQALAVDDAWICTINGMASRILREHALELGLDPAFEVISESQADDLRAMAVEQVVRDLEHSEDPLMRELLASERLSADAGGGPASVVDKALRLLSRLNAMPAGFDGLVMASSCALSPGAIVSEMYELGMQFKERAALWPKATASEQKMLDQLDAALEAVQAWQCSNSAPSFDHASFNADAFRAALYAFPPTSEKFHASKDDAEFFASYRSEYARLYEEAEAAIAQRRLRPLVELASLITDEFARRKGASRMDNSDLLTRCARALREHPEIAERYRRRFKLIMVDEFQDTDKLQVDIISSLALPGLSNVCTVGDAQQSIYRFRGADVNVFFGYREALRAQSASARFVELPDNFRSHRDILSLVDAVFSQNRVFGKEFLHLEPCLSSPLNAQADPVFAEYPRVSFDFVHYKTATAGAQGATKQQAIDEAARHVAAHFDALRARGAKVGDMALLLGTMRNADAYAQALRAVGIESVIAGGSVFCSSAEAMLVSSLLRVAVNMRDERALFNVLTSSLFALSDDVLLALATTHDEQGAVRSRALYRGFSDTREGAVSGLSPNDAQALLMARELLGRFCATARGGNVVRALRELLVSTGLLDRLEACGSSGLAPAGNLAKALVIVGGFERAATGIAEVQHAYDEHLRCAKEAPGSLATVDSDFVRIMTVHASKGLEFPHVAVADLASGVGSREALVVENVGENTYAAMSTSASGPSSATVSKLRTFDCDGWPHVSVSSARTPGELYGALLVYALEQTLSEAQRLLYVALTRASRSLYVSCCMRSNPENGYEKAGIYGDLHAALGWDTSPSAPVSMVDYGGTALARVNLTYLTAPAEGADERADECESGAQDACVGKGADPAPFAVARRERLRAPVAVAAQALGQQDVFSYSSIEQTHAGAYAAQIKRMAEEWHASEELARFEDEESTALGTAFHRLAQRAVCERGKRRSFSRPPEECLRVQAARNDLSPNQEKRLTAAVDRWFSSDVAARFANHAQVAAEVPFMVKVEVPDAQTSPLYLEGEIDGLASNGDDHAFVVDYKTGGFSFERADDLHAKHLLQAQCYAYALMRSGFSSVEAHFVRIEHACSPQRDEPQVVTYHFNSAEIDSLAKAILSCAQHR